MKAVGAAAKAIFLALFAALLLLPAVEMATSLVPVAPLPENRTSAAWPSADMLRTPSLYMTQMRGWFQDHYGFRALLIRVKTEFDYRLFRTTDRIYVGRHHQLFYRSVVDAEQPAEERMTDADLDRVLAHIAALRDQLARRGIRMLVITNGLKDRFYPEDLPRPARIATTYHRFDDFRARLHTVPGILYIDPTDMLQAAKHDYPVFYKTDFHWDSPAAFPVARAVVETIAADAGMGPHVWHYGLELGHYRLRGGQSLAMPLFEPLEEDAVSIKPTWPEQPHTTILAGSIYDVEIHAKNPAGLLPTTVLYGDSFAEAYSDAGIADYFAGYLRARRRTVAVQDVIAALPADTKYFIYEFVETTMPNLATADQLPPTPE